MYRLLSGFITHLTQKEEFSVLIIGLDNAGKTTFFERVKSTFNETPPTDPASIAPTIGQNIGRITLSSSVLQFWDLGGQRDIRSIWPKYYSECHALCFVIDSSDKERLEECWNVFETVVSDHRVDGVPTLVLANKQDAEGSMAVEDIKQMFNKLIVEKLNVSEGAVMPISALKGDGIREAVNWLFLRVQNSLNDCSGFAFQTPHLVLSEQLCRAALALLTPVARMQRYWSPDGPIESLPQPVDFELLRRIENFVGTERAQGLSDNVLDSVDRLAELNSQLPLALAHAARLYFLVGDHEQAETLANQVALLLTQAGFTDPVFDAWRVRITLAIAANKTAQDDAYKRAVAQGFITSSPVLDISSFLTLPPDEADVSRDRSAWTQLEDVLTLDEVHAYYARLLSIESSQLEGVFQLAGNSTDRLVRAGLIEGAIEGLATHSNLKTLGKIVMVLKNFQRALAVIGTRWSNERVVTASMICEVQKKIVKGNRIHSHGDGKESFTFIRSGAWRSGIVGIRGRIVFHHPQDISASMDMLLELIPPLLQACFDGILTPYSVAAWLHHMLISVHPFDDGNGRTMRLIASIPLMICRLPMIDVFNADRDAYFGAIREADDKKDLRPLATFFHQQAIKSASSLFTIKQRAPVPPADDLVVVHTTSGSALWQGEVVSCSGSSIHLLSLQGSLLQTLPFELAFPLLEGASVDAVAFDSSTSRIAAVSRGRVGVWEERREGWKVHSSFAVGALVDVLDFAKGRIACGGENGVTVWQLDESAHFPSWSRVGWERANGKVLSARLSPSAGMLATVLAGSNSVRLSSIAQFPTSPLPSSASVFAASAPAKDGNLLRFRSNAWHSVPIRRVDWRPSDSPSDSGPILITQTMDNHLHLWGCMIDEPDFFSLWATLDVHSSEYHRPLFSGFLRTRDVGAEGKEDDFLTVFEDGSTWLTTVSKFDRRPPTCLSQSSTLLQHSVFTLTQLPHLRYPLLFPSTSSTSTEFTLAGRNSLGTLVTSTLLLPLPTSISPPQPHFTQHPRIVQMNKVGRITHLVQSFCGESLLARGVGRGDGDGRGGVLQSWEVSDEGVAEESYVKSGFEDAWRVRCWHDGKMVALVVPTGVQVWEFNHAGVFHLVHELPSSLPLPTSTSPSTTNATFFIARTEEESLSTSIVLIVDHTVWSWTYSSSQRRILEGSVWELPGEGTITTVPVPLKGSEGGQAEEEMSFAVVDEKGKITFWSAGIPDSSYSWKEGRSVMTGKRGLKKVASSSQWMTAIVSKTEEGQELSIWDSKESEFASGEQLTLPITEPVLDLHWSLGGHVLAVATASNVSLFCAERLDDLSGSPGWTNFAQISVDHLTSSPISAVSWLARGIAIASGESIIIYSSELTTGGDCHHFATEKLAPLPYHHPQLLFQSLLHGLTETVIKILTGLAAQLTDDGDLTPIKTSRSGGHIRIQDFLKSTRAGGGAQLGVPTDIFSALTDAAARQNNDRPVLSEEDTHRLLATLKKCSLRGLTKLDHAHLAILVQTVYEIQRQQGSLDANGLKYLVSMRSFFLYNVTPGSSSRESTSLLPPPNRSTRLKYRDAVWAFHSESQELLVDASVKACGRKLLWSDAKALALFFWIKSQELMNAQAEAIARAEYIKPDSDDKDPITASLFYLALRKRHMVLTLWKQAGGHPDRANMVKLLANDFELPRWKSAALKNAFVLLSKQRFLFAAVFFLLGDSLKDAVSVCLRQLDDFALAIAIARLYEGDDGPVLKSILEGTVLPLAFKQGFRWLGSWAFWMLKRRDLAVQTIVTPLADLASTLPYELPAVGRPSHEDPCLVLLFAQLRSWSLQTVKGATAVEGKTEFNFVLHMSRVLTRMGCHLLALNLVQSWEFIVPLAAPKPSERLPRGFSVDSSRPRHSLRRFSTKLDLDIPSNLGSRAPSPEREKTGGAEFHQMLKETKKVTQAPPEFNMDNFF